MQITAKTVWKSPRRLEAEVIQGEKSGTLYFEASEVLWAAPPARDDFAAVALCQHCAAKKADLYIDGRVTRSLLGQLDEFIKIWSVWRPDIFSPIQISARDVAEDEPDRNMPAVLAFSGGVDASFSLAAHQSKLLGASSREIGLGVLVVGFDLKADRKEAISVAYAGAKKALGAFGAGCAVIETNWQRDFCPAWLMGYTAGVACVLTTLSDGYGAGIVSNGCNYLQEMKREPSGSHTMINRLLGSYTFPMVSTGGTHTRIERIGVIRDYPALMENLRVCWQEQGEGKNCGVCEKCVRTRLELMIHGLEPDIFRLPLKPEHIEKMDLSAQIPFEYFEDIYLHFPKEHPLYAVIEKKYLSEKDGQDRDASLLNMINAKNAEILRLKTELDAIRATKSYKLTAPLRFIRKRF